MVEKTPKSAFKTAKATMRGTVFGSIRKQEKTK